jgi:hypothetical protein
MQNVDMHKYRVGFNALTWIDLQVPFKFKEACYSGFTEINATLAEEVCKIGNMDMLWCLYEIGCPFDSRAYKAAKYHCHQRCLEFLQQIGCHETTALNDRSFTIKPPKKTMSSGRDPYSYKPIAPPFPIPEISTLPIQKIDYTSKEDDYDLVDIDGYFTDEFDDEDSNSLDEMIDNL